MVVLDFRSVPGSGCGQPLRSWRQLRCRDALRVWRGGRVPRGLRDVLDTQRAGRRPAPLPRDPRGWAGPEGREEVRPPGVYGHHGDRGASPPSPALSEVDSHGH